MLTNHLFKFKSSDMIIKSMNIYLLFMLDW